MPELIHGASRRRRVVRPRLAALLGGAMLLAAGSARAGTLTAQELATDQDILHNFNLVVFGNYAPTNETEGPVIVGGNYAGNGNDICFNGCTGANATINGQTYGALTVFGNVSGNVSMGNTDANVAILGNNSANINLRHSGNLAIVGTNTGTIDSAVTISTTQSSFGGHVQNGGTVLTSQPLGSVFPYGSSISGLQTDLQDLATGLAGLAAANPSGTSALPAASSNESFTPTSEVTLGGEKYSFVTTTLANLASETNFDGVNDGAGDAATFVIVTGDTGGALPNLNPYSSSADVIWDFVDATSLSFAGGWTGTILAPFADITGEGGDLRGSVVANAITQTQELHFYSDGDQQFGGNLNPLAPVTPPNGGGTVPTPEPASAAVLAVGLVGLIAQQRRRSRARA